VLLAPTFAALMLVPLTAVAYLHLRRRPANAPTRIELRNPLQLAAAVGFGAVLVVLFITAEGLRRLLGNAGAYAVAAIAGVLDVDAVSLAMAEGAARGALAPVAAARAIALAVLVNTAAKGVLAAVLGGMAMLRTASLVLAAALAVGLLTALATL
jgi:uncharacterized membrane protein (DUF4010 family)